MPTIREEIMNEVSAREVQSAVLFFGEGAVGKVLATFCCALQNEREGTTSPFALREEERQAITFDAAPWAGLFLSRVYRKMAEGGGFPLPEMSLVLRQVLDKSLAFFGEVPCREGIAIFCMLLQQERRGATDVGELTDEGAAAIFRDAVPWARNAFSQMREEMQKERKS